MLNAVRFRTSLLGVVLPVLAFGSALAEDNGTFEFKTTFDNDFTRLQFEGETTLAPTGRVTPLSVREDKASYAFAGSANGRAEIVKSSGDLFAVGDTYLYECVASGINVPGWVEVGAYCVMNDTKTGDQWYRKSTRTAENYDSGTGKMVLLGGTGKFARVRGDCLYQVGFAAPWNKGKLDVKCNWQMLPDEVPGAAQSDK